ncbi:hypothetical protein CPB83DRAFT_858057 [Crepidotus variabilis]|uniref:BTB domain-containing protein n=1 Tax=Crepidotus variabilis TaxID=179855 RepID=A0A9P6JN29_9AGAR|nr:hypothetical protein CPB83DRAFT_858057 [Crepidotus variabilis]
MDGRPTEKHSLYYIDLVSFQVESTRFRVPTIGFISSNPNFFQILKDSDPSTKIDHETAIELSNISKDLFEGLLLVMYPFTRTAETYQEWLGALDLSNRWGLHDIKEKSILGISKTAEFLSKSSLDLALFSKQHRVGQWLRNAYIQLVKGEDLNVDDLRRSSSEGLERLDFETISRLLQAQLLFKSRPSQGVPTAKVCQWCILAKTYNTTWAPGYEVNYRCPTHPTPASCVDRAFWREFAQIGSTIDNGVPSAGHRLALKTGVPLPYLNLALSPDWDTFEGHWIFLASAIRERSVIPCKTGAGTPFLCVALDGKEIRHQGRFDILPYLPEQMELVLTSYGKIPDGRRPIEGGYEEGGSQLYHAVAAVEGLRIPGKTGERLGAAKIALNGIEHTIKENYHILCWR